MSLTTHLHLHSVLKLRMSGSIRLLPPYVFMECIWKTFTVFTSLWAKYGESFSTDASNVCSNHSALKG